MYHRFHQPRQMRLTWSFHSYPSTNTSPLPSDRPLGPAGPQPYHQPFPPRFLSLIFSCLSNSLTLISGASQTLSNTFAPLNAKDVNSSLPSHIDSPWPLSLFFVYTFAALLYSPPHTHPRRLPFPYLFAHIFSSTASDAVSPRPSHGRWFLCIFFLSSWHSLHRITRCTFDFARGSVQTLYCTHVQLLTCILTITFICIYMDCCSCADCLHISRGSILQYNFNVRIHLPAPCGRMGVSGLSVELAIMPAQCKRSLSPV